MALLPTLQDFIDAQKAAEADQTMNKQGLLAQLESINKKYDSGTALDNGGSIRDTGLNPPDFTRMDANFKSDNEITDLAKASLTSKQSQEKQNLNDTVEQLYKNLVNKQETAAGQAEEQKASIEKMYADRRNQAENDALKRGIARSTIIQNKIEQFDNEKIQNTIKVDQNLKKEINDITDSINTLEVKKNEALKNFDIQHAAEIVIKINELIGERDKKQAEALKYNNDIALKEAEYLLNQDKYLTQKAKDDYDRMQKELKETTQNPYKSVETAKMFEKVAIVKTYYSQMPPKAALADFLADTSMKYELGNYYQTVLEYLKERAK